MSGSKESDDELVSGRVNYADDLTRFWARRKEDKEFHGPAIFVAEPALSPPDGEEEFTSIQPSTTIDGVVGVGHTAKAGPGTGRGIGVIGQGGHRAATGVMGIGGRITDKGEGGIGVHGIGVHGIGGNRRSDTSTVAPGPDCSAKAVRNRRRRPMGQHTGLVSSR